MSDSTDDPRPGLLDRAISAISPKWAANRAYYRATLGAIPQFNAVYRGQLASRLDTGWNTTIGYQGANHPLNRWRLTKLRDRARDMERNNAIACGMLDRCVENVIGHGMRLQAQTDDQDFNDQAEDLWNNWTENCDIRGIRSWSDFQRLIFRSHLRDGDVGVAFVQRGSDLRLQAIEGDQIDTPYGGYDLKQNIFDGVQFNADGRPIAFHIVGVDVAGQRSVNSVAANDFVFYSRLRSLSQTRGEPCYAQVFKLFDQIDGLIEATVVAARIAACQALLIRKNDAAKAFSHLGTDANSQGEQQKIQTQEPGMVHYLNPGEDVVQVNPNHPSQNFPDFISQLLRFAGVTLGLPLELVLLDFSRTNYSSARASLLQAYRTFKTLQKGFQDTFLARTYRWRISKAVKSGELKVPASLQGDPSRGIRPSFWKHGWIASGWAWVDPVKELQAAMMSVDAGLDTLTNIAHQHGYEWNDMIQQRANELAKMKELEVPLHFSTLTRDPAPAVAPGQSGTTGDDADIPDDSEPDPSTPDE